MSIKMADPVDIDWSLKFGFGSPRPENVIQGICIHTTENDPGTPAENVANYQITTESGSYHVLVDDTPDAVKSLRENTDDWNVWAAGPKGNWKFLHLSFVARAAMSRENWLARKGMLSEGADVVAAWCVKHQIPPVRLTPAEVRAGKRGVCGHVDISEAWHEVDHVDPGAGFPWDVFLGMVDERMNATTAPAPEVVPAPAGFDSATLALHQLAGPDAPREWGWPQLGGRTLVDAVAAIGENLGIEGFKAPKEGK